MTGPPVARDSPANQTTGGPLPPNNSQPTNDPGPDGATLLDQVCDAIATYVILPTNHDLNAVTLWIAASHGQPFFSAAPRLVIRAPEKRCGKSRLLDLVEAQCHNPLITVNASPPAVYRSIGVGDPPTLLIDEADTIFGPKAGESNEELRGLLNAGHQRNRAALRYNAADKAVEHIPTFAMAALAGIGVMPDTIEDRAIVIRMRRRAPGEQVQPYRYKRDAPPLAELRTRLREWIRANGKTLEAATPLMPLEDRAADTWEPLFAVADLAGGHWPDRAREGALALTAAKEASTEQPRTVRLLADCRTAFGDDPALTTEVLLSRLKDDTEAPWATFGGRDDGLTPMKLGAMLRDYDIRSARWRIDGTPVRGYKREAFADAWQRYCPPPTVTESGDDTGPDTLPLDPADPHAVGEPVQPVQPVQPWSTPYRLEPRTGSSRHGQQGRTGSSRYGEQADTGLTCDVPAVPAVPGSPPNPAVCIICREPLTHDDGTHAHPLCTPA